MKHFWLTGLLTCLWTAMSAQVLLNPVLKAVRLGDGDYRLQVQGDIANGWHVYAADDLGDGLDGLKLVAMSRAVNLGRPSAGRTVAYRDALFENRTVPVYLQRFAFEQQLILGSDVPASLRVVLSGFAAKSSEFVPVNDTLSIVLDSTKVERPVGNGISLALVDLARPLYDCGTVRQADHGILMIFLLGFMGGLLALLTPCVFPMVPLTVSWFGSQSANKAMAIRNGMLYGLFILLIYLLGSLPFHLIGSVSPEVFNSLSTNVYVNLFFFLVFVFFALSFFGLFEITVSGKVSNAVDSRGGLGSLGGIFFMALTLALVSFSCTGPILGSLLVGSLSSSTGAWALTAGMGGFGLALGIPFALFAMFPSWMKRLPKSGGWLGVFKKSLAFVELALAFKFLSNADLVQHWGLLPREVFIFIWIIISLALAGFLLGWTGRGATDGGAVGRGRRLFGILALVFALYLVPGLTNTSWARLELLSGFPPPLSYSIYGKKAGHTDSLRVEPQVVNDYEAALALSKKTGKKLMVDFTGWACVNCRKMEENVWTDSEVAAYIKENFILVSLYVDDRKELPLAEQTVFVLPSGQKKGIRTVGDRYATFQSVNFAQVTQPLYVILDDSGRLMNSPVGYTPDAVEYLSWLRCGNGEGK